MNRNTIKRLCKNPWLIGVSLSRRGLLDFLPDKQYIDVMYRARFERKMDWDNPKTFNEKLQWLKLYDRQNIYSVMADKYEAKQYAADKIGESYIVPALAGPWDRFDEINFDALPNQFVLKTTHDCGGVVICKDKASFDRVEAKKFLERHLKMNYYLNCREWPYKNIKPRIFAEEYLADMDAGDLKDYKFFCFNGVPKLMFIASERQSKEITRFDFYDMDFNHLDLINGQPNSLKEIIKPEKFELMKDLAATLSAGIPHIRVDFYEINGHVYLGEMTFYHYGGFVPFQPAEWDVKIGEWLELPKRER